MVNKKAGRAASAGPQADGAIEVEVASEMEVVHRGFLKMMEIKQILSKHYEKNHKDIEKLQE